MLDIQVRTNSIRFCSRLEHSVLLAEPPLTRSTISVLFSAILHSRGLDYSESWVHDAFLAEEWCSRSIGKAP
jgi:hypothetical protein